MDPDPGRLLSRISSPAPYRTSSFAILLLCAIASGAIVIMSLWHWPDLKDHGWWQLAIFAGSMLVLCTIMFFLVRRVEAHMATRRARAGKAPRIAETGIGTWVFATLLFGGGGVLLLWPLLHGRSPDNPRALGTGTTLLFIGLVCARMAWTRIRRP